MMNHAELIALRGRLIAAYANNHSIGAAEAYVRALEAEVVLTDFNSRRGSVKHLLALVDAALESRKKLPTKINRQRDFTHPAPVETQPLRGHTEIADIIDEASFSAPVESPEPTPETKPKKSKGKRVAHGKGKLSDQAE